MHNNHRLIYLVKLENEKLIEKHRVSMCIGKRHIAHENSNLVICENSGDLKLSLNLGLFEDILIISLPKRDLTNV